MARRRMTKQERTRQIYLRVCFVCALVAVLFTVLYVFLNDASKKAAVVDDRHVRFGKEITSLSALAKFLLGCNHPVQGTLYFKYKGKVLDEMRKECAAKRKFTVNL